jgi:hypothetical protein
MRLIRTKRDLIRGLLVIGLTAGTVVVAGATATATQGDTVTAGGRFTETTATTFVDDDYSMPASCSGYLTSGVAGCGEFGGVFNGDQAGVYGRSDVMDGLSAYGARNGAYAYTLNDTASGVYGQNYGHGNGVAGRADHGVGVLAASKHRTALAVDGKASFSRSGLSIVPAGKTSRVVQGITLTSKSFVIATVQDETDVAVKAVVRDLINNSFTIVLTKPATFNTPVGWFVLN